MYFFLSCVTIEPQIADIRPAPEYTIFSQLEPLPGWETQQNVGAIYSPDLTAEYLRCFIDTWMLYGLPGTREDLESAFDRVEIHWQKEIFVSPNETRTLLGLAKPTNKKIIYVFVYDEADGGNIGFTMFGHELMHVALLATESNIQPTHFGSTIGRWYGPHREVEDAVNLYFLTK